jgi:hypothetical protein
MAPMSRAFSERTLAAVAASVLVAGASALAAAQQDKATPNSARGDNAKAEKVSGVILKVEKVDREGSKAGGATYRLSINTNAVWRDWARDQAQARDEGSPKKDAAKGANSIATKGEPVDENSLVVVEVATGTKVETRFRSPTDETTKGAKSPDQVKTDESTGSGVKPAGKPVQFRTEDLAPGLFVEADFRPAGSQGKNMASSLTVIRPIRVLESSPATKGTPK